MTLPPPLAIFLRIEVLSLVIPPTHPVNANTTQPKWKGHLESEKSSRCAHFVPLSLWNMFERLQRQFPETFKTVSSVFKVVFDQALFVGWFVW